MSLSRRMSSIGGLRRGIRGSDQARTGTVYNPKLEPGCFMDLWAENLTDANGAAVSWWFDTVSGHDFVQSTVSLRPVMRAADANLNLRKSVRFANTGLGATAKPNASTSWTVYVFANPTSSTDLLRYFLDISGNRLIFVQTYNTGIGGGIHVGYYSGVHHPIAAATTGPQALVWTLGGGTGTVHRGNTLLGSATYEPKSWLGSVGVGIRYDFGGNGCDIDVGRLLVYSTAHDAATRARVLAWGSEFYAITL